MTTCAAHGGRIALVVGLCVTLLAVLPGAAQQTISAGLRGGVNLAMLQGDDVEEASMRTQFNGGLFMTYRVNDLFAIQPEILFSENDGAANGAVVRTGRGGR